MTAATIVLSGGIPVTEVASGAPVMNIVVSGGIAITLTINGAPFVLKTSPPSPEVVLQFSDGEPLQFSDGEYLEFSE